MGELVRCLAIHKITLCFLAHFLSLSLLVGYESSFSVKFLDKPNGSIVAAGGEFSGKD